MNSPTGLSAGVGGKEKSEKQGVEREWGKCGPGCPKPQSTPPSHWAVNADLLDSKNAFPILSVLTLQIWESQAKNQPVKVGGSNPCLMIRIGVSGSRPLGWVCRYSWAVARAFSFSVALASAPIHKNTCVVDTECLLMSLHQELSTRSSAPPYLSPSAIRSLSRESFSQNHLDLWC